MTAAEAPTTFSLLTTFRVGGPIGDLTVATTRAQLLDFARAHPLNTGSLSTGALGASSLGSNSAGAGALGASRLSTSPLRTGSLSTGAAGTGLSHAGSANTDPVLFIAGGSNLLISDAGFAGPACLVRTSGTEIFPDGTVRAQAGVVWDELVAQTVAAGLSGLEALSGVPGSVGATPVQNVGAYGGEVADVFVSLTAFDRATGTEIVMTAQDLEFGYRTSVLKRTAAQYGQPRYVVLDVTFQLDTHQQTATVRYAQLAQALGVELGAQVSAAEVRAAVLKLRAAKGMVLAEDDHDTWSAGSFFTNPILPALAGERSPTLADKALPAAVPVYPVRDPLTGEIDAGVVKTSAAWLIDHAGFTKGFGLNERATLSTKHTLALTNRGNASAADIVSLARHIQAGVKDAFGVELHPEPNLVGINL